MFEPTADDAEELLLPLRLALRWEMTSEGWIRFGELVDRLDAAWREANRATFTEAVRELVVFGPRRVVSLNSATLTCIPTPIRDRVVPLVHALEETAGHTQPEPGPGDNNSDRETRR